MFTVTVINQGTKFWLRGTTWAFHADRANQFATRDEAQAAIERASKFGKPSLFKRVQIEESVSA